MESSLSPILITLGLIFINFAIIVESDARTQVNITRAPPPPSPPPPSPPSPPPPIPPPPPESPPPPATPPPPEKPPPPATPPPPERPPPPASPPPPPKKRPPPRPRASPNKFNNKSSASAPHRRPPPKKHDERTLNTGKKIGLLFAGIAAILQIGVLGFLVFKRRQLLKINDRY